MAKRTQRTPLTDDERAARRRQEQELTERAVAQLRSSSGWQRWLAARAQAGLRRLSVNNQLLVMLQDDQATYVAGFRAWLRLGYCVRRGETSRIRIWAPCPPSKAKMQAWRDSGANPTTRPRTYFRLEAVFSQDQVEELPPPAEAAPLAPPTAEVEGDSLRWALAPLEQLAAELGYRVEYQTLEPGHGGSCDYRARVITINTDAAINAQVSVACHELGHALTREDRQEGDPELDYATGELVAESVAHLAVSYVGLDSSAAAIPYLAGWAEAAAPDAFEQVAGLVDRLARRIEDTLGAQLLADDPQASDTALANAEDRS